MYYSIEHCIVNYFIFNFKLEFPEIIMYLKTIRI